MSSSGPRSLPVVVAVGRNNIHNNLHQDDDDNNEQDVSRSVSNSPASMTFATTTTTTTTSMSPNSAGDTPNALARNRNNQNNSFAIRQEIHRFENVHPAIYAIYDLLKLIADPDGQIVAQRICDYVASIEGKCLPLFFLGSHLCCSFCVCVCIETGR